MTFLLLLQHQELALKEFSRERTAILVAFMTHLWHAAVQLWR